MKTKFLECVSKMPFRIQSSRHKASLNILIQNSELPYWEATGHDDPGNILGGGALLVLLSDCQSDVCFHIQ